MEGISGISGKMFRENVVTYFGSEIDRSTQRKSRIVVSESRSPAPSTPPKPTTHFPSSAARLSQMATSEINKERIIQKNGSSFVFLLRHCSVPTVVCKSNQLKCHKSMPSTRLIDLTFLSNFPPVLYIATQITTGMSRNPGCARTSKGFTSM